MICQKTINLTRKCKENMVNILIDLLQTGSHIFVKSKVLLKQKPGIFKFLVTCI
jgi:hypothetical protein